MNDKIIFINDLLFWPIVVAAILLWGVFVLKELAMSGRRRLLFKIILSIMGIGALALIALKPAIQTSETGGTIVLLTPGYEKSQLDSLKKEYSLLKVLDYSPLQPIPEDIYKAEVVYIIGYGLREYDLQQLENIPSVHLRGRPPEGVVKVKFPKNMPIGENLNLLGLYRNPHPGHRLILQGPGGSGLDSVDLNNTEEQQFQLATQLKAAGNFVYFLAEKNPDGKVLSRNPIPVEVEEKSNLRILILNTFPTFETKYLKNFLAEAGHELVVRSQITRGRYKYEYFNTERTVIGNLMRENLESYDLLIIDAASLRNLGGDQSRAIEDAVQQDGMGVFIQPDDSFFVSPGTLVNMKFVRQGDSSVKLEEWPEKDLSKYPFTIFPTFGQQSIYQSEKSMLAGYKRMGQGRIGTTVLFDTWHLVLDGNSEIYRQVWSRIIEQMSKREDYNFTFEQQELYGFPNEPYHFKIRSETIDPLIKTREGRVIPIIQDFNIGEQWMGTVWPQEEGWSSLQPDTNVVFNFYVAEEGSWRNLTAQNTLETNQRYFARPLEKGPGLMPLAPINPLWFYGIFLLSMGALWLEPKLS